MGCKESDLTEQLTLLVNLTLISLYSPSVQLLGGMAVASLVFKEIAINFFQSGCAILPLQMNCFDFKLTALLFCIKGTQHIYI